MQLMTTSEFDTGRLDGTDSELDRELKGEMDRMAGLSEIELADIMCNYEEEIDEMARMVKNSSEREFVDKIIFAIKRSRAFIHKRLLTALALLSLAMSSGSADVSKPQQCSFDPDCKDPQAPYCNITYSLHGNFGTCSAVDEPAPLQVLGDQECPEGTVRQLIYQNEGDEAVCLEK